MRWVLLPIAASWGAMVLYFVWQGRGTELYNCLVRYGVFYAENGTKGQSSIWMNLLNGFGQYLVPI